MEKRHILALDGLNIFPHMIFTWKKGDSGCSLKQRSSTKLLRNTEKKTDTCLGWFSKYSFLLRTKVGGQWRKRSLLSIGKSGLNLRFAKIWLYFLFSSPNPTLFCVTSPATMCILSLLPGWPWNDFFLANGLRWWCWPSSCCWSFFHTLGGRRAAFFEQPLFMLHAILRSS